MPVLLGGSNSVCFTAADRPGVWQSLHRLTCSACAAALIAAGGCKTASTGVCVSSNGAPLPQATPSPDRMPACPLPAPAPCCSLSPLLLMAASSLTMLTLPIRMQPCAGQCLESPGSHAPTITYTAHRFAECNHTSSYYKLSSMTSCCAAIRVWPHRAIMRQARAQNTCRAPDTTCAQTTSLVCAFSDGGCVNLAPGQPDAGSFCVNSVGGSCAVSNRAVRRAPYAHAGAPPHKHRHNTGSNSALPPLLARRLCPPPRVHSHHTTRRSSSQWRRCRHVRCCHAC